MAGAAFAAAYHTAFEVARQHLVDEAEGYAQILASLLRYESEPDSAFQILWEAQNAQDPTADTREITVARREGDHLVFFLQQTHDVFERPARVDLPSGLAEPMQRALAGERGWMTGRDYHGDSVLAAFQPVAGTEWGLVAKMNLFEVRAPFWRAAIVGGGAALVLVFLGVVLSLRTSEPFIRDLEASDERWQFALEGGREGVWDWDARKNSLFCSKGWCDLMGLDQDVLEGTIESWVERVHPDDRPALDLAFQRHLAGETPFIAAEYRIRRADGEWLWALDRGKVVRRDAAGKPLRAVGTLIDLTERKRAEEHLQRALHELESAKDHADYLNRVLHALGRVNQLIVRERDPERLIQQACEVLTETGAFRTAWIALEASAGADIVLAQAGLDGPFEPFAEAVRSGVLPPCTAPARSEAAGLTLIDREETCQECPLRVASGQGGTYVAALTSGGTTFGYLRASPATDEPPSERAVGLLREVAGDIGFALRHLAVARARDAAADEIRRQAERIRVEEQKFRDIFHGVTDGLGMFDPDTGLLLLANRSLCDMLGYSEAQLQALELGNLLATTTAAELLEDVGKKERREHGELTNLALLRSDGTQVVADVRTSWVDLDGRPVIMGSVRDVTARRSLEEQLFRAQRMEAIGRLAGGIAHDFNNLLTVILTSASFAAEEMSPGHPVREDLREIHTAGERAATLVRQLLAFSRRQAIQPHLLDLNQVLKDLQPMLERLLGEDVALHVDLTPRPCHLKADTGHLEQVVMNLAVNARDAMPEGGRLTLETRPARLDELIVAGVDGAEAAPHIVLRVSDSGVGMDESTREHLFEPFFTTKGPGGGTGLGLATVYGIVSQLGGHIRVESARGRGTVFELFFPTASEGVNPRPDDATNEDLDAHSGHETVLVVEDEGAVRRLATRVLSRYGYGVLVASDGREAEEVAERHDGRIDLLLSDVVMPGPTGPQTAERLLARHPEMRVLYMSGYADRALGNTDEVWHGLELIEKPFAPIELARRIRRLLDR